VTFCGVKLGYANETVTVPVEEAEQVTPEPNEVELDEVVWEVVDVVDDEVVEEMEDVCDVCGVVEEVKALVYEDALVVSETEEMDVVLGE
jgi:hypothetical protein